MSFPVPPHKDSPYLSEELHSSKVYAYLEWSLPHTEILFLLWQQFQNKHIYHFNNCPGLASLNGFCGFKPL